MPRRAPSFVGVLILTLSCPFSLVAADRSAESCYRLNLQEPPSWITSGAAWDRENERLLMVDPVEDRVVSYNLLGERDVIPNLSPELRPVKIGHSNDGFLLELADGTILSLDRRLAVTGKNLAAKLSPTTRTSLYQWAAATPGTFTAFAAVVQEKIQYGLYTTQNNSRLQLLLPADERQKDFLLLGYPYLAAGEDATYFLSMAKHPAVYRVSHGRAEKLSVLPPKYATRPDFTSPPVTGPSSAVARYAELETFSIPAGLYAQEGHLYLLTREPAGKGKTTWWLYEIDPAGAGRILGQVRLPTTAPHLTVIATPDRGWMLIERGRVELDPTGKHQVQKIGPVVVVSNGAIHSHSIPNSCPLDGGILWADQNHSRALFVPEGLLASRMILPVDLSSRSHFDLRLAEASPGGPPCDLLEPSSGQGTLPDASGLRELVDSSQIAVVGKILSTEPGWDVRQRHVVTKVNLEVVRPLKGALKKGSTIDFLSSGGSMVLAGKRICTTPRSGFYQPRKGDEILVSADPSFADARLLEAPYVFPLSGGKVQPEPYPALSSGQGPLSLNRLLEPSSDGTF